MAAAQTRSNVPDLLFEDTQDQRLLELAPLLRRPEDLGPTTPLNRITVFGTYGCNLACAYCKAARRDPAIPRNDPGRRRTFDLASFRPAPRFPSRHADPPPSLHGGDASLVRSLPEMVRCARTRGGERLSITTNGTLPSERYLALVDAGLGEIHLSLNTGSCGQGGALAGREGSWKTAAGALSHARRSGQLLPDREHGRIPGNRSELPSTLQFLLGLRPRRPEPRYRGGSARRRGRVPRAAHGPRGAGCDSRRPPGRRLPAPPA